MHLPKTAAARIISCDVFDTLLHRDHRSERQRFNDIAVLAARRLASERRIERHSGAIYDARIEVQKQAYRALDLSCPTGDVRFADMIEAMARILSLDAPAAEILHEAELEIERQQLKANAPLLAWLGEQAQAGCRIIAVSDIYHRGDTIAQLLAARAPHHPVARIYTSADHNATKRTGALFEVVLLEEGVAPAEILHIGDDGRADVTMAQAAGLRALQVLRPGHLVFRRRADALRARVLHALRIRAGHGRHGSAPL
ncbi:HAD family hydrolase [Methylobacterium sp. NEAU K]|uniref:HAD family hydrolase n=1 Tax=Methylobacterium sp. NEAU K TaxID=3064946 RepID=UPI00351DE0B7